MLPSTTPLSEIIPASAAPTTSARAHPDHFSAPPAATLDGRSATSERSGIAATMRAPRPGPPAAPGSPSADPVPGGRELLAALRLDHDQAVPGGDRRRVPVAEQAGQHHRVRP